MWLALDAADAENGCLVYTTGSHKTGIRPHQASGVLGFSQKCACHPLGTGGHPVGAPRKSEGRVMQASSSVHCSPPTPLHAQRHQPPLNPCRGMPQ